MIDYDNFSHCHLTDIFFRYFRGSERVYLFMHLLNFAENLYKYQAFYKKPRHTGKLVLTHLQTSLGTPIN